MMHLINFLARGPIHSALCVVLASFFIFQVLKKWHK
jgi:hypothetical protein